jgi:hypothetical protein
LYSSLIINYGHQAKENEWASMVDMRKSYKILFGNHEEQRPLWRPRGGREEY